jgi:hypothetical protein
MIAEHADERFYERHGLLGLVLLLVLSAALFVWPHVQQAMELSRRLQP